MEESLPTRLPIYPLLSLTSLLGNAPLTQAPTSS
jgi:hypothetical protein